MEKFWKITNASEDERILTLNGTIAEESWFEDDITPAMFRDDLSSGSGNITVWINSPGGDCFAAASIYNMLLEYPGKVTVKIDGLAASAASVIAMAGDRVLMSPVSMLMIHNPATIAMGDHNEMSKAIAMLDEVKNSIINAYAGKTKLSRKKLSQLMEDETWMDAKKAVELGFCDEIMKRNTDEDVTDETPAATGMLYSSRQTERAVINMVVEKYKPESNPIDACYTRLFHLKKYI